MALDYEKICKDLKKDYGPKMANVAKGLADINANRTHFIFELLQNAEDAITRRGLKWNGARTVSFHLTETHLRISHYGVPFSEADVRGICGIFESTKTENPDEIGRFGLGFKSVYTFTDRPEIHSGPEDFAINSFVWPEAVPPIQDRDPDETVFIFPFKSDDKSEYKDIADGLQNLEAKTLLFLRQIEEICWSVEDGPAGQYLRKSKEIDRHVRSVTVTGDRDREDKTCEEWLIFSRPVTSNGHQAGHVEIAFFQVQDEESKGQRIQRVEQSPLVVFFPTAVETHLGFLVQGPYQTATGRETVPEYYESNKYLARKTACLLVESLRWLQRQNRLNTDVLRCLPLESMYFSKDSLFVPLFEVTKRILSSEPMLPRSNGGYLPAEHARLGGTQELRDIFSTVQLTKIYGEGHELAWLSDDITQYQTHDLYWYLRNELKVTEVNLNAILQQLGQAFLESQPDNWILKLYEFLNRQRSLRSQLANIPLIRLEDGSHVTPKVSGRPQAFLPIENKTDFPTVRGSVCTSEEVLSFLKSLGLEEPNPVDDVILHVLPKYQRDDINITDAGYQNDIERMLDAYNTDSKKQQGRLIEELKKTRFVRAIDSGNGFKKWSEPSDVYLATERLKKLFDGVKGILHVDDSQPCLRGEKIRDLLERCEAVRYLRPIRDNSLPLEECAKLRQQTGYPRTSGRNDRVTDQTLHGLEELLVLQPSLAPERRKDIADLLWEELTHLEERRGKSLFTGSYTWTHYGEHKAPPFDAAFVRQLKETAWVPNTDGELRRPEFVPFDNLDWKKHPFLQSKIPFKPPIIDQLAKEVGIELGVLDKIKEYGITEEDLVEWVAHHEPEESPVPDDIDSTSPDPNPRPNRGPTHRPQIIDPINHEERMEIEEKAIELILACESDWLRTPINNPGYDLYQANEQNQKTHWCEVKSISDSLEARVVSLSSAQFECAQKHGEAYWLYIVEHADDKNKSCIIRIQDPAQKVGKLTAAGVELDVQRDRSSLVLQARFKSTWKDIAT